MLLNDFFEIINLSTSQDDKCASVQIKLNAAHDIFKGHFPDAPVVPGVCIIQIIKEILSEIIKKDIMLTEADEIKFHNAIVPNINPVLNLDFKINLSETFVAAIVKITFDETTFCQFKGKFGIGH